MADLTGDYAAAREAAAAWLRVDCHEGWTAEMQPVAVLVGMVTAALTNDDLLNMLVERGAVRCDAYADVIYSEGSDAPGAVPERVRCEDGNYLYLDGLVQP